MPRGSFVDKWELLSQNIMNTRMYSQLFQHLTPVYLLTSHT